MVAKRSWLISVSHQTLVEFLQHLHCCPLYQMRKLRCRKVSCPGSKFWSWVWKQDHLPADTASYTITTVVMSLRWGGLNLVQNSYFNSKLPKITHVFINCSPARYPLRLSAELKPIHTQALDPSGAFPGSLLFALSAVLAWAFPPPTQSPIHSLMAPEKISARDKQREQQVKEEKELKCGHSLKVDFIFKYSVS